MKISQLWTTLLAAFALSVSTTTRLQAIHYISNVPAFPGNWGYPYTWTAGFGFPDTYANPFESATILPINVVNYDGSNPSIGGNLLVAWGSIIDVYGGTLKQTWAPPFPPPFGTVIFVGVSHPFSGAGTLNINAGGLFDTGTADGVAVGITNALFGTSGGNGTVNINNGTMRMAAASGLGSIRARGLGVGINTGVGVINVGDGLPGPALLDLNIHPGLHPALLTIGGDPAGGVGGTGTVNIRTDGTLRTGTQPINVGDNTGNGTLNIGGILTGSGEVNVGRASSTGLLIASAGSAFTAGEVNIGRGAFANGDADINGGIHSILETSVGRDGGNGTLSVNSGTTTVNGSLFVGRDGGSTGNITIANGTVQISSDLNLGAGGGTGVVNVNGGTANVGGSLTVNTGSTLHVGGQLNVKNGTPAGSGNLNVTGSLARIDGAADITGQVTVGAGGTLAGIGTVTAPAVIVLTGGTVSPGASVGTLRFAPSLQLNSGSTYLVEITGVAAYDKVISTGSIVANGQVRVVLSGYAPVNGDTFDVADGSISGTPTFDLTGAVLGVGLAWDTTQFVVNGTIRVVPSDPYNAWAAGYGLTGGKTDDDDADGGSNLLEFATDSNPAGGGSKARVFGKVVTLHGDEILTLTVAVRNAAAFTANGANQKTTKDQMVYTVEATNDLATWNSVIVTELNPADSATVRAGLNLPTLDAGWEWHTFRAGTTTVLDGRNFVRLSVAVAP